MGHPSGDVMERRWIVLETAEDDKASRPVNRLVIATIFEKEILNCE